MMNVFGLEVQPDKAYLILGLFLSVTLLSFALCICWCNSWCCFNRFIDKKQKNSNILDQGPLYSTVLQTDRDLESLQEDDEVSISSEDSEDVDSIMDQVTSHFTTHARNQQQAQHLAGATDNDVRVQMSDYRDNRGSPTGSEDFSLERTLDFTREFLLGWQIENEGPHSDDESDAPELDITEFMAELEARWNLIDHDHKGRVTVSDLRLAVWDNEPSNQGDPIPSGDLPEMLQDIIDDIADGVGLCSQDLDAYFTYWDFVNYLLSEADGVDYGVRVESPDQPWAECGERTHLALL